VNDRTEDVRRHESVTALVEELRNTLTSMREGDLSARADFADEYGVVDDRLVNVVDQVNDMGERFQLLARRVDEQAEELAESVDRASGSAETIEERVDEQSALLSIVATEMENFSARMQEVAACSDQVASAAELAKAAADSGLDSSEGAREAIDNVIRMSDGLVKTVTELELQMTEIEGVIEVIAEVVDQMNLLALNANIEAARAGDAGSGFEVVADEVKELQTRRANTRRRSWVASKISSRRPTKWSWLSRSRTNRFSSRVTKSATFSSRSKRSPTRLTRPRPA
jgi:methyl-accepting chemotaxis protein